MNEIVGPGLLLFLPRWGHSSHCNILGPVSRTMCQICQNQARAQHSRNMYELQCVNHEGNLCGAKDEEMEEEEKEKNIGKDCGPDPEERCRWRYVLIALSRPHCEGFPPPHRIPSYISFHHISAAMSLPP